MKKTTKKNKTKKNLIRYFIEFLIVAFGVFLGIYVNKSESQDELAKNKEKTVLNIIKELERNQKSLKNSIAYHKLIKTEVDSVFKTIPVADYGEIYITNKYFQFNKLEGWVGLNFAKFENTAFDVAKMSGNIQNMDLELTQEISKIYYDIKTLSELEKSLQKRLIQISYDTKTFDIMVTIGVLVGDNLYQEEMLSIELEESINSIKKMYNKMYKH